MVIKSYLEHWDTYAKQSGLSGVLFEDESIYMLFGKHQLILKLARLLGRKQVDVGLNQLAGPVSDYLCR